MFNRMERCASCLLLKHYLAQWKQDMTCIVCRTIWRIPVKVPPTPPDSESKTIVRQKMKFKNPTILKKTRLYTIIGLLGDQGLTHQVPVATSSRDGRYANLAVLTGGPVKVFKF